MPALLKLTGYTTGAAAAVLACVTFVGAVGVQDKRDSAGLYGKKTRLGHLSCLHDINKGSDPALHQQKLITLCKQ